MILDEYHFGAWQENAKKLFEAEDKKDAEFGEGVGIHDFDEEIMPITTDYYLYLSGTPFGVSLSKSKSSTGLIPMNNGPKPSGQIKTKTRTILGAALPRMVLMTYQLPDEITEIALQGEFNEFDLNTFFKAEGEGVLARFKYENEVQKWLNLIRSAF